MGDELLVDKALRDQTFMITWARAASVCTRTGSVCPAVLRFITMCPLP